MDISHYSSLDFIPREKNNIRQMTNAPDFVTNGSGDKYIGYEHIGETYSGNRRYVIEERDRLTAKVISQLTGDGIFLDIACGDGCLTVPAAELGTKIIAGDISNSMLEILQDKAKYNGVSLENVLLCRMNALDISLKSGCIATAAANSVLHLISNPEKVVDEIYRVLRDGGCFICVDDAPGRDMGNEYDNSLYNEIVSGLYSRYWEELGKAGISPQKFSWKFDRHSYCLKKFDRFETIPIPRGNVYHISLGEGFLPRFMGRGFSDQVNVPGEIHRNITEGLLEEFSGKYGEGFADTVYTGVEEDLLITVYKK